MSNNHTNIKKTFETKKLVFQPFSKSTQNEYLFKIEKPKNPTSKSGSKGLWLCASFT